MKITLPQLRRIIKEEVKRSLLREMEEAEEADAFIEIPDIRAHATGSDMSVKQFCDMVRSLGQKRPSIRFEDARGEGDGYSREYDSLHAVGSKQDLDAMAQELDDVLMGGAQSISDEDSFTSFVDYL